MIEVQRWANNMQYLIDANKIWLDSTCRIWNFYMNILKYGLHDTSFNTVKIGKKGISLSFNNGIYLLDENGKEKSCIGI